MAGSNVQCFDKSIDVQDGVFLTALRGDSLSSYIGLPELLYVLYVRFDFI